MTQYGLAAAWGLLVAASLVAGAMAAAWVRLPGRFAALVTAFGGGLLLAAVALELVPEADAQAGRSWTAIGLLIGAVAYVGADAWISRDRGTSEMRRFGRAAAAGMRMPAHSAEAARGEAIAAGIVVDGIPESLALGLMAAEGGSGFALLVAVVVGNVSESYGAAQPIIVGHGRSFAVRLLTGIGLALGASTVVGAAAGASAPAVVIGTAQAVAAGAVLAVVSISIFPYAFEEASRRVAVVATLGFVLGYVLSA